MQTRYESFSRKIFLIINITVLLFLAVICFLPMIHILAVSLSDKTAASAGFVKLLPVNFTLVAYTYVLNRPSFWMSFYVTLKRVLLGGVINLFLTVFTAYPLSKSNLKFKARSFFAWFFFFSTLFSGGLIPGYMLIFKLGLMDTLWALILPGAVPVFNVILMLNFFRQIPIELEEAAFIDGASHWKTLFRIYIPCSLPSIATVTLFSIVHHWNSYFDGMIYSNFPDNYPLQTYLRSIIAATNVAMVVSREDWRLIQQLSDRTVKASQIFIAAVPVLCVYPFLQKYFVKGITIGSVKG